MDHNGLYRSQIRESQLQMVQKKIVSAICVLLAITGFADMS